MYGNVFDSYVHVSSCKYGDNLKLGDLKRSYFCATHQDGIFFDFVYLYVILLCSVQLSVGVSLRLFMLER